MLWNHPQLRNKSVDSELWDAIQRLLPRGWVGLQVLTFVGLVSRRAGSNSLLIDSGHCLCEAPISSVVSVRNPMGFIHVISGLLVEYIQKSPCSLCRKTSEGSEGWHKQQVGDASPKEPLA